MLKGETPVHTVQEAAWHCLVASGDTSDERAHSSFPHRSYSLYFSHSLFLFAYFLPSFLPRDPLPGQISVQSNITCCLLPWRRQAHNAHLLVPIQCIAPRFSFSSLRRCLARPPIDVRRFQSSVKEMEMPGSAPTCLPACLPPSLRKHTALILTASRSPPYGSPPKLLRPSEMDWKS